MFRVLIVLLLACVCDDVWASAVGHANSLAKSSPKKIGSYENCVEQEGKGTDDNEVLYFTKADGKTVNFVCEKSLCGDDSYVAILGEGCIRNGDKCYKNRWFYCSISLMDDAWLVAKDFSKKEEMLNLCSKSGDNYVLTSVVDSHKAIIVGNKIYEDYYIDNVARDICWAYICNDGFVLNSDKSACEKIICDDGATQQTDDCGSIANAYKCTKKCVGGTRLEFQSLDSCVDGYRVENGTCVVDIKADNDCKSEDLSGLNASAGTYQMIAGQLKCVATECQSGAYKVKKNDVYHGYCMFDTCVDGKKLKLDNEYTDGTCEDVVVETSADEEEVAPLVENNTDTETETDPTDASTTSAPTDEAVVQSTGEEASATENASSSDTETETDPTDASTTSAPIDEAVVQSTGEEASTTENASSSDVEPQPEEQPQTPESATVAAPEQDDGARVASQEKVDKLKEKAQLAKDKEQSTANKLLGAVGIGATGVGGMMLASGVAEQNADVDAENAMRAYLATFTCNYGAGKNVRGGETNVELPGANELIALYSEYVNLANDLKVRKAALGMKLGIESEPILDSATSGLHDDVAVGKSAGAYASLSRALADPNGADAEQWREQKDSAAHKQKTGAVTAGVGAAGSLVGDLVIHSGKCDVGKRWDDDTQECVDKK